MKRTGFARPAPKPAKVYEVHTPRARECAVYDGKARLTLSLPRPKTEYVRDESYRRWVASLPCAHCGKAGPSQAAHADEGKGMSIKASDDTCYPLCADAPGRRGCHSVIGASGMFTQAQRRALEATYQERTRALWKERTACA